MARLDGLHAGPAASGRLRTTQSGAHVQPRLQRGRHPALAPWRATDRQTARGERALAQPVRPALASQSGWCRRRDSNPHCTRPKRVASCQLGYAGLLFRPHHVSVTAWQLGQRIQICRVRWSHAGRLDGFLNPTTPRHCRYGTKAHPIDRAAGPMADRTDSHRTQRSVLATLVIVLLGAAMTWFLVWTEIHLQPLEVNWRGFAVFAALLLICERNP